MTQTLHDSLMLHANSRRASTRLLTVALLAGLFLPSVSASAQHNADMWLGQSSGRIAWQSPGLLPGSVYHPLDPVDTFIHGWSDNDPGFDHVVASQNQVVPLPSASEVMLEVVDLTPSLFIIDNGFQVLAVPGDATLLGGSDLHVHLTWFIDEDDPDFDETRWVWEATLKFVDDSGTLDDSSTFTLLFTNVDVRSGGFPPVDVDATGDFDVDGDVDRFDHRAFVHCAAGPLERPMPSDPDITDCEVECHNAFDFDNDMNLDLEDFAELQVRFGD